MHLCGRGWAAVMSSLSCCLVTFVLLLHRIHGQERCTPPKGRPSCVCETDKGLIDLTSIANTDGTPRYTDLFDPNGYEYTFNPCYSFSIGDSGCTDAVACQNEKFSDEQYSCGSSSTETFIYNPNGDSTLEYSNGDAERSTIVTLHCQESATTPSVTTTGDYDDYFIYKFDIYSACACPGGCGANPNSPGSSGGTPSGWVGLLLIFIIFGCLISYFAIGIAIMRFKYEKTGLDVIPHSNFWFAILSLVKDGGIFTYKTIVGLPKRFSKDKAQYDQL